MDKLVEQVCIRYVYRCLNDVSGDDDDSNGDSKMNFGEIPGYVTFFKDTTEEKETHKLSWQPIKDETGAFRGIINDPSKSCTFVYDGPSFFESEEMQKIKEIMYIEHGFTVSFPDIHFIRKKFAEEEDDEKEENGDDALVLSLKDGSALPSLFFTKKGSMAQLCKEFEDVFTAEAMGNNEFKFIPKERGYHVDLPNNIGSHVILGDNDDSDDDDNGGSGSSSSNSNGGAWYDFLRFDPVKLFGFGTRKPSPPAPKKPLDINKAFVKKCFADLEAGDSKLYDVPSLLGPEQPLCDKPVPLTKEFFAALFDDHDGACRMTLGGALRLRAALFGGAASLPGAEPEVRAEAWKYMLGYYAPGSTRAERAEHDLRRKEEYAALKAEWKGLSKERQAYCTRFYKGVSDIRKDAPRTDREHPFFEQDSRVAVLMDVLITYFWFALDVEYVQGMNDYCAVLLETFGGDEAVTFWCFKAVIDKIWENYRGDFAGFHAQVAAIGGILECVDPALHECMRAHKYTVADCGTFLQRWLLVSFKREYQTYDETKRLWEMFFSGYAGPRFELFVAVAMIMMLRGAVVEHGLSQIGIMQMAVNAGNDSMFPLDKVVSFALRAYNKFCNECVDMKLIKYVIGIKD